MASWNYRMVKKNEDIGIYSVYYRDDDSIEGMSLEPAFVIGYSVEGLAETLELMKECLSQPILIWGNLENEE